MTRIIRNPILFGLLAAAFVPPVFGQNTEDTSNIMEEIVVMATKREQTLQEIAIAVSVVDAEIQPPSYALSLLGMTGLTAWAGMVWQAQVKQGDKVLIPAVTGGVGAAAVQFCRMHGAEVIGVAGGEHKCEFAKQSLGVGACIDRKRENVAQRLDDLFPEASMSTSTWLGVNCSGRHRNGSL